jgi:diguanylate cyclase (GGDEF)-like protein
MAAARSTRSWLRTTTLLGLRSAGAAGAGAAVAWRLARRGPPRRGPGTGGATGTRLDALLDRSALLSVIGAHLATAPVTGALLVVDLDRFKAINDHLGHDIGDEVLLAVSRRIASALPGGSSLARLSSDEFVAFVPTMPGATGVRASEGLLDQVRVPVPLRLGREVFPSASIGVADVVVAGGAEDALRHAHAAMVVAKGRGGNGVAFYDEAMHATSTQRFVLETALRRALDRHELSLDYQPLIELDGGGIDGFEALLRWRRDDGSSVSPVEFIPIAEDTGSIVPIGAWVLLEALTQLRTWIDDGSCPARTTMSVNVSPRQLVDPGFAAVVEEALRRSATPAASLWLEITETAMITDTEAALTCLHRLVDLGVRIALDDFGTGFSSLSLLQRFPLQRLKVDRAFVSGVADRPGDRALVRTIVAMATALGLDLVAEGVETAEQLRTVHELGCGIAQGYLLCHPLPAARIPAALAGLQVKRG